MNKEYKVGDKVVYRSTLMHMQDNREPSLPFYKKIIESILKKIDNNLWFHLYIMKRSIPLYKKVAKIIDIDKTIYASYLLEFEEFIAGDDGEGKGKDGHCHRCSTYDFRELRKFKIGDRVCFDKSIQYNGLGLYGKKANIIEIIKEGLYVLEFEEYIKGHSYYGKGKQGHCYITEEENFELSEYQTIEEEDKYWEDEWEKQPKIEYKGNLKIGDEVLVTKEACKEKKKDKNVSLYKKIGIIEKMDNRGSICFLVKFKDIKNSDKEMGNYFVFNEKEIEGIVK